MLFEAFARNRLERPEGEAFLIPSGDRYFPVSWKRFTDDIALVAWIVDTYAPRGMVAILGENGYDWTFTRHRYSTSSTEWQRACYTYHHQSEKN